MRVNIRNPKGDGPNSASPTSAPSLLDGAEDHALDEEADEDDGEQAANTFAVSS